VHRNASEKKQGQFHQGQYVPVAEKGRPVCRIHKFPGSLKKYLPKKADCMDHIGTAPFGWIWLMAVYNVPYKVDKQEKGIF